LLKVYISEDCFLWSLFISLHSEALIFLSGRNHQTEGPD
jgi:hypothetical protein